MSKADRVFYQMDSRTKHISVKFHYARELKSMGRINFKYCSTGEMLADIMT